MLDFKLQLKIASSYIGTNFFDSESIGIIARGPSNLKLDLCIDKFRHCFLAGEFNHTLNYIGQYLIDKDIVLCSMKPERYRTTPENCRKYNINNIQTSIRIDSKEFNKIKLIYPDLKVVGYTNEHCVLSDKIFGEKKIFSTGIMAIFHALYFKPKNIYIIGLDFFDEKQDFHSVQEKMDEQDDKALFNSALNFREGMIQNLYKMCDLFATINFHLFTTFRGIKNRENLRIKYIE